MQLGQRNANLTMSKEIARTQGSAKAYRERMIQTGGVV